MLAYTTAADLITLPTGLEAAIYITGLLTLMACPYLVMFVINKASALTQKPMGNAITNSTPQQNNS